MPEEGLETAELREQLEEAKEHAHGHHGGAPPVKWMTYLSLSTAIIAVIAAISSLYSGSLANDALLAKNEAIHKQAEASDEWTRYQAKSIKSDLYESQLKMLSITAGVQGGPAVDAVKKDFNDQIEKQAGKKDESMGIARGFEKERDEQNAESAHSLHRHHQFARAVTIFQVAIALSAIAALTKLKPVWLFSMLTGIAGIVFFAMGFMPSGEHGGGGHGEHAATSASAPKHGAPPAKSGAASAEAPAHH